MEVGPTRRDQHGVARGDSFKRGGRRGRDGERGEGEREREDLWQREGRGWHIPQDRSRYE